MDNLQSTLLKGYKLEERIGSGGFGAVYRAKQTTIEREVAVKIILPGYANNPDFIRRFEAEAQLVARLEHPHITPLIDYWRDPDGAYLVMRYLRGGSIRQVLQNEQFELNSISQILDQLASALDFAHRNRVIHRDIKPENILLDEDGNVYLADFGIAKDLTGIADGQTAADAVVGSLNYISPEQARSEPVTSKTDIYSLGVTLYEMITGEHPFKEVSSIERLYKHINDPLPEIENLPDDVREEINEIIQKATAKNPEHRYADVAALAIAFREGIGRGGTNRDLNIVEQLTMREQEILSLIADGLSNREIADKLVVTVSTVKWHITQVYKKLGVRSRMQAIVRARELNLVVDDMIDSDAYRVSPTDISLPEPENPYKGLHAFQTNDSRDFFGRNDLTQKLIEHLDTQDQHHRFLAIVGPSGSGKSSLVRAGVIPALWKGAIEGSDKWFVVDMIPGTHPIDKLETALIRVAANQANNLREQLQRDERGLLRIADIILPNDDTQLVIVIDQFEEVFTLVEQETTRQHFLNLLLTAVSDVRSRIRVIVTLRADYYDRPLHYPEFGQLVRTRMETILPLSAKGLERAIRGPAERVGVSFEQGLVEQIVSEMNYQSGALPLLQYALTELFDRRQGRLLTNEAYQQIGGAVGALANRADEIYQSLPGEGQELARQMFMRMVTLGEGAEDTRKRIPRSDLLALTENADLVEEIIDQFAAYRLLSLDHDPETRQPTVEVAHEAILREWELLRMWLNESRDEIRLQQQLSYAAKEWRDAHQDNSFLLRGSRLRQFEAWAQLTEITLTQKEQDFLQASMTERKQRDDTEAKRITREQKQEQRSRTLLYVLVAVFALATLLSTGLGTFAFIQRNTAIEAQEDTLEALDIAERSGLALAANAALEVNEVDLAIALAHESVGSDDNNLLPVTLRILERIEQQGGPMIWNRVEGYEYPPIFSRDRRYFVMRDNANSFSVWETTNYDELKRITHSKPVNEIIFSPDGTTLITYYYDKNTLGGVSVTVWDMTTWNILATYEISDAIIDIDYSYDPALIATVDVAPENEEIAINDNNPLGSILSLRNVLTGDIVRQYRFEDNFIQYFDFMPDGSLGLVTGWSGFSGPSADDYRAIVFDVESGDILHTFDRPHNEYHKDTNMVSAWGGFNEDGTFLFLSGYPNYVIDIGTGENYGEMTSLDNIRVRRPDPQFNYVMTDTFSGNPTLFNIQTGESRVFDVHFTYLTPQDGLIMIRDLGRTDEFQIWDITGRPAELAATTSGDHAINQISFSPDGQYIVASSQGWGCGDVSNNRPTIYDASTLEMISQLEVSQTMPWALEWSPDGQYIASGTFNQGVLLFDVETGEEIRNMAGTLNCIGALAFTRDSQYIIAGHGSINFMTYDSQPYLMIWDVETGEEIQRIDIPTTTTPNGGVVGITVHPNMSLAYVTIWVSPDPVVEGYFIDLDTGEVTQSPRQLIFGNFTSEGYLVGAEIPNNIVVFDPLTQEDIQQWSLIDVDIFGLSVSPDGRYVATGSGPLSFESAVSVWDIETGRLIRRYFGHDIQSFIFDIAFNPDGTQLATSAFDTSIRIWDFDAQSTLEWMLENRVVRDFTCAERTQYRIKPLCEEDQ